MQKQRVFKILALIVVVASLLTLTVACTTDEDVVIKSYTVSAQEYLVGDTFGTDKVTITANKSDDSVGTVPATLIVWPDDYATTLKLAYDEAEDVYTFTTAGNYSIVVSYLGEEITVDIVVS